MHLQPGLVAAFCDLMDLTFRVKIVDIGASGLDGGHPYAVLQTSGCAEILGFEPNPVALAQLNADKGEHETYLPYVIGDGGRHTLNICWASGMTSLLTPNPAVLNLFHGLPAWGEVIATEPVDTRRLDDIEETLGVEMIKIDIQGAELMVFSGAEERLKDTLVIHTEAEFLPLYIDQPLFSEVEQFLRQRGFMLHRFYPEPETRVMQPLLIGGSIYSNGDQVIWSDAVFVRDFTRLDLLTNEQLIKLSAILHDCYGSVDLVMHLLAEHDRRAGGGLAADYLARLQRGEAAEAADAVPEA